MEASLKLQLKLIWISIPKAALPSFFVMNGCYPYHFSIWEYFFTTVYSQQFLEFFTLSRFSSIKQVFYHMSSVSFCFVFLPSDPVEYLFRSYCPLRWFSFPNKSDLLPNFFHHIWFLSSTKFKQVEFHFLLFIWLMAILCFSPFLKTSCFSCLWSSNSEFLNFNSYTTVEWLTIGQYFFNEDIECTDNSNCRNKKNMFKQFRTIGFEMELIDLL